MKRSIYASKILAVFLSLILVVSCNVPLAWGEAIGGDSVSVAGANQETASNEEIPSGTDESDSNTETTGTDPSSEEGTIDNESEDAPTVETTNETVASLLSSARSLASEPKATTPVAEVVDANGTVVAQFDTLSNAISEGEGKTVRLLQNLPAELTQYGIDKSMTLDLNGYSIDSTKNYTVGVNAYQKEIEVTIKNGTICNAFKEGSAGTAVFARQGGNVTLENVMLEANSSYGYGIQIGNNGDKQQPTVTVQGFSTSIYGTIAGAAIMGNSETGDKPTLVLNEGTIQGEWYGIAGNGSIDNTSITINGGVVKALEPTDAKGIYHPQDGDLTINGGKVQGPGAVQYCGAGTLKIAGGELRATEALVDPAIQKGDGSVEDGAALSLVSRGGGYGAAGSTNVSITGGSLISDHNVALLEYGVEGIESLVGTLAIGGGSDLLIAGGEGKDAVQFNKLTGNAAQAIAGGLFSSKVPVEYCAPGYVPTDVLDNGRYSVQKPAIQVWNDFGSPITSAHGSLSDAFAAAAAQQPKHIVAIVGDYTLESNTSIPENTYLDVRDGATLTVPSDVTLTVPDNCMRLGIWSGGTLNIQDGGKVLIEGGDAGTSGHGFVMLQKGSTLNGELSVPNDCFLQESSNNYVACKISDAVLKLEHNDGSVQYATKKAPFGLNAYRDGDTLTFLDDVEGSFSFSRKMTIDLGGHVLSSKVGATAPTLIVNDDVVLKNGTVKARGTGEAVSVSSASFTVESGTVIENESGIGVVLSSSATLNVSGTIKSTDGFAISGNGSGSSDNTKITINEGATVTSENEPAIYHPQIGTIDVLGGAIRGATGIEIRSGDLNVSGNAHIEATATNFSSDPNENGSTSTGVGIAVAQHTTGHPINVNITGGDISGIYALHESNPQNNIDTVIAQVKLSISGGTFKAIKGGTDAVSSKDVSNFITGGTFNTVVPTTYYDTDRYAQNAQDAVADPGKVVPHEFSLTYDLKQGMLPSGKSNPATYTCLDEVTLVNPERAGYTFAGWTGSELSQATVNVTIPKDSKGNRAYVATWTANPASIVFETNGGAKIDALEGVTDGTVTGTLLTPVRGGFKFAGWFDNAALTGNAVTSLPATFPLGTTTFYAKWTKEVVEGNATIVVELPGVVGDDVSATVVEDAADRALDNAKSALDTLKAGGIPDGVSAQDAAKLKAALADTSKNVVVKVTLGIERIDGLVSGDEKAAIENKKEGHEEVAASFDLSVLMTVEVIDPVTGYPVGDATTVSLSSIDKPLLFELRVDPDSIAGKSVRIAHVHDGATEIIYPESVDRAAGTVRFFGYKFSTYALLTSSQVTVHFDPAGGAFANASDATQIVAFGAQAVPPTAPTRAGYQFTGWFTDTSYAQPFDFSKGVENTTTVYAGWVQKSGGSGALVDNPDKKKPPFGTLVSTGDKGDVLIETTIAFALVAGLIACAVAVHRRRRGER